MKKEIEKVRQEKERQEEEKLMAAIHSQAYWRNKEEERKEMLKAMDRQMKEMDQKKRAKRNERIALIVSIALLVILILFNHDYFNKGVKQCVAAGHSESWCVIHG